MACMHWHRKRSVCASLLAFTCLMLLPALAHPELNTGDASAIARPCKRKVVTQDADSQPTQMAAARKSAKLCVSVGCLRRRAYGFLAKDNVVRPFCHFALLTYNRTWLTLEVCLISGLGVTRLAQADRLTTQHTHTQTQTDAFAHTTVSVKSSFVLSTSSRGKSTS